MIFLFPRWDMLIPWRVSFVFILPDRMGLSLILVGSSHQVFGRDVLDQPGVSPLFFCRLCLGKLKLEFRILSLNSAFFVPKIGKCVGGDGGGNVIFLYIHRCVFGTLYVGNDHISHIPTKREEKVTIIIDSRQTTFGRRVKSLGWFRGLGLA